MSDSFASSRSLASGSTEGKTGPPKQKIRGSPPTSATELAHLGTKSGYLRKEADNEKGLWSKYFFVVKPSTFLYYYKTEKDEYPRGVIDLEYMTDVRLNSQCIKRSVGGSHLSFRVAADVKTTELKKIRPLFLDIDQDEREGETPEQRQARLDVDAKQWMQALQGHRYIQVDSQKDELSQELKQLKERLAATEATVSQLNDKLDHILRRSKYTVKEALSTAQSCREQATTESYETLVDSLDALSSLEKLGQLVGELTAQVHTRNEQLGRVQVELTEERLKNNPAPASPTTEEEPDELNPETFEAVLDDSQGAISSKQIRLMKQKSMRTFTPNGASTQMLSSAMSLGFSKAKAVTSRLGAKLQRQATTATPKAGKWTRVESKQTPGTFTYVNEATGEEANELPFGGVLEDSDDDGEISTVIEGRESGENQSTNDSTVADESGWGSKWKLNIPYAFAKGKKDGAAEVKEIDRSHHQF
ncbi:unnamed protein product [Aphanomyces euteiches]|uniref:PH domain-containing protein n=1 Tax=Aphanomyces euteiches TaxID=100861 RepID=A0A6G0XXU9_9STRA|nr:hypothetical protein Ae201684_000435 [Aphanomyces euteiches]KAH9092038.1 hypothetical protein Ae201684P_011577 [Aphanomyces euteiches]KAH9156290.1 hypothetical protein AeRB84_001787 [Aphanomyces euteiches]